LFFVQEEEFFTSSEESLSEDDEDEDDDDPEWKKTPMFRRIRQVRLIIVTLQWRALGVGRVVRSLRSRCQW